jgi:hypothetical protein
MDPFLEDSEIWPDFHHSLAEEIKGQLNAQIGPKYYANVEIHNVPRETEIDITKPDRIRPDVGVFLPLDVVAEPMTSGAAAAITPAPLLRTAVLSVRLRAVRIYKTKTSELVTTIEILSPYNKRSGEGVEQYRLKRLQLLNSAAHLVELDLLRGGLRPGFEIEEEPLDTDYVLLVNRAGFSRVSEIWPLALNEPFPVLPVPLLEPDPDVPLELGAALRAVYTRSGYAWRIDYRQPVPSPELRPAMAAYVRELLAAYSRA